MADYDPLDKLKEAIVAVDETAQVSLDAFFSLLARRNTEFFAEELLKNHYIVRQHDNKWAPVTEAQAERDFSNDAPVGSYFLATKDFEIHFIVEPDGYIYYC